MAVFRVERNSGYTVMSNHHLRNKELTLKAKGLLSQMLSLPEDWDYTLAGLSHINRESIDAIRTAVWELEKAGYILRRQGRDEKGNTIIVNTKGEGAQSTEDFWVKAERLYYTALIGYIHYEAPEEEKNFITLLDMINASDTREDDEDYKNPVDLLFDRLEEREPEHFAVNTPSVDELEEKAKRGEVISLSALAAAVKAEDGRTPQRDPDGKKPSIRAQLKVDRAQSGKPQQREKEQEAKRSIRQALEME